MSDIAYIGDRDTVWPFKAFGIEVFYSDEHKSLPKLVSKVLGGEFRIIFVTEDVYGLARESIDRFAEEAIPTFVIIPSVRGNRGTAIQLIRESVRRAMGAELV